MTMDEARALVTQLNLVFDIVRFVDVRMMQEYTFAEDGQFIGHPYHCYNVWKKKRRCENCISAKAFIHRGRMTKFEFIDNEVYHVIAMYTEIDKIAYVLEMVTLITDEALFSAYGNNEFVETINRYNRKLYTDPLTGVYNRRYYEEQLSGLSKEFSIAMLDVDDFKNINDTYGHKAGDDSLCNIVTTISSLLVEDDSLIRYGGDEFLILFQHMNKTGFIQKLESIRKAVENIRLQDYPSIKLSVSIGGISAIQEAMDAIEAADIQLYKAKHSKNCIQVD